MNISQAIQQLIIAVRSCSAVDEHGQPLIPQSSRRPILLYGPPGIGKTYAVREAADALGIGFLSYTMTHHTRQSALGLPQIVRREFNGIEYAVTEYTMSEIMRDVYAACECGKHSGILFLDEINCVSETLMPAMLELLQFKRFGSHRLPDGWIIVCAGNPEDYNRSARAFDSVTLDRVRLIRVEPDINAYLEYASAHDADPAVLSYLRLRPDELSLYEASGSITPRTWSDLSVAMRAMIGIGETPGPELFEQFLQIPRVCDSFASYYAACASSGISAVLDRVLNDPANIADPLSALTFDLRVYVISMIAETLVRAIEDYTGQTRLNERIGYFLSGVHAEKGDFRTVCEAQLSRLQNAFNVRRDAGIVSASETNAESLLFSKIRAALTSSDPQTFLSETADRNTARLKELNDQLNARLNNALTFVNDRVSDSSLRVIFASIMKTSSVSAAYLRTHPSEAWARLCASANTADRSSRLKDLL